MPLITSFLLPPPFLLLPVSYPFLLFLYTLPSSLSLIPCFLFLRLLLPPPVPSLPSNTLLSPPSFSAFPYPLYRAFSKSDSRKNCVYDEYSNYIYLGVGSKFLCPSLAARLLNYSLFFLSRLLVAHSRGALWRACSSLQIYPEAWWSSLAQSRSCSLGTIIGKQCS